MKNKTMMMKTSTKLTGTLILGAFLLAVGAGPAMAHDPGTPDEAPGAATAPAVAEDAAVAADSGGGVVAELLYVIKTTPALVYLDAGTLEGIAVGDAYLLLREDGKARFLQVGEARVIRVDEEFCIAEVLSMAAGHAIEVLDQAISVPDWQALADEARAAGADPLIRKPEEPAEAWEGPRTSLHILGGAELGRNTELVWAQSTLMGADDITDAGVGLRLGKVLGRHWRLNFTWRLSGKPLGLDGADVTQVSLSVDTHLMFRGVDRTTPYIGLGAGGHRLTWDATKPNKDSATKGGANLMAGLHIPVADGHSSLLLEGGYQLVTKFDDMIDTSHIRLYAGLGRSF